MWQGGIEMKKFIRLLLSLFFVFSLTGCHNSQQETDIQEYTIQALDELKHTDYFLESAITHIFLGEINKKGQATGYHYDPIKDSPGTIVEGTKSKENDDGVYQAQIEVNHVLKSGNKGYSTFYPDRYSPQEVVDMINEAYQNRQKVRGNTYRGSSGHIVIEMYLTKHSKIITAYPLL